MKTIKKNNNILKTDNKFNKYFTISIIIIALIIIILLLLKSCFNHNYEKTPTGNIDIFDLKCDLPTCQTCENCQATSPRPNTNDSTIINNPNSELQEEPNPEEELEGFNVFDDKSVWTTESELRIFANPAYEFDEIIAPGSSNSYVFRVRNNNDFDVSYSISLEEENIHNINMKYRLKKAGVYIKGSPSSFVTYNDLNIEDIFLNSYNYDEYALEWYWEESPNDTEVGTTENASYKLHIKILGIEV